MQKEHYDHLKYDIEEMGDIALQWASATGHIDMVKLLLNEHVDIEARDYNRRTPLIWAADNSHKEKLELLLDNGADINIKDYNRRTPLLELITPKKLVELLLEKDADIRIQDSCKDPSGV